MATAFPARHHRFREFYLRLFIIQEGRQEAIRSEINNYQLNRETTNLFLGQNGLTIILNHVQDDELVF